SIPLRPPFRPYMAEIRGNYQWRRRCGTKTCRCGFSRFDPGRREHRTDSPLVRFAIFEFGRDTSSASNELVYVARDASRSVCFSTHVPPSFGREGNHCLRSPARPACITASPTGTGPASPAMLTGVAEAERGDCRHRFWGGG